MRGGDDGSSGPETGPTTATLLKKLRSKDGLVRERAREALVTRGAAAVGPLIALLGDKHEQTRWEAAKALATIAEPACAPALVQALEDEDSDVRWIAAEGLIEMGAAALKQLLEALVTRADSVWLREGAHHVLHDLRDPHLRRMTAPLLAALGGAEPEEEFIYKASEILRRL